jgi:uncharacterized repeat protein (TIGR01451 family)
MRIWQLLTIIILTCFLVLFAVAGSGLAQENVPLVVSLDNADVTLVGEDNGDWAGYFASPAGDVDGDGLGDLLVGAPQAGNKVCPYPPNPDGSCPALAKGEGVAYLVLGRSLASGPHAPWSLADADASFLGCETTSMTARQLYTAGDVNGDGYDDMIISGWKCGESYTGKAYLFLGRQDVTFWGQQFPVEQADASFLGEQEWDFLSYYVSTAGDVNDDGLDDLLISATHYEEDLPCEPGLPPEQCGSCCRSALDSVEILDATAGVTGTWTTIDKLATARFQHSTTLLADGSVLAVGGQNTESFLSSTEIWDAGSGLWSNEGSLATARSGHTASLLSNGSVLAVGGQNGGGYLNSSELFDPDSGVWSTTGSLSFARGGHTATLLPDGRVLVIGGRNAGGFLDSVELWTPSSASWTSVSDLATARSGHTATLLPDGRVLVVGGQNAGGFLSSAELFDPDTLSWIPATAATTARASHSATLLPDGRVLVVGGQNGSGFLRLAELYSPAADSWTAATSPNSARSGHSAALLTGGRVLVAGGQSDGGSEMTVEFYDLGSDSWTKLMRMSAGRTDHGAVLLPDGKLLALGGRNCTNFGKIYLILGRQAADWGTDYPIGTADASFLGEAPEDRIGRSVTGVGDTNGDGYDDFLIGSVSNDYGGVDAGQNYLFLGRATPGDPSYDPARPWWGTDYPVIGADASFVGEAPGDESGRRVSGAGDVNGDGYSDMIVGAARNGTVGYWAGITHLILGRPAADWGLRFPLAAADASFVGEETGDQSGRRMSGAGDVNDDGYDDFIIGAPHNDRGGEMAGSAYLILGRPAADWGRYYSLSQADVIYVGKPEIGVAGYDQGWLDDWNGDGINDFLVAAYGGRNNQEVPGEVYILFGHDASIPSRYAPAMPKDYLGWRKFTTEYWNPHDWHNIAAVHMILGRSGTDALGLNTKYIVSENALYLWDDGEAKWSGPCAPGDLVRLSAGSVRLDCGTTSVINLSSRMLQVEWGARWLEPITDSLQLHAYLRVVDQQGSDSGLVEFPWPADVAIRKTAPRSGFASPGAPLTYTLTFGNAGGVVANNVVLTDVVPSELGNVRYSSNYPVIPVGDVPYSWLLGDLAPMQGGTIVLTGEVSSALATGYRFTNTAIISATQPDARANNRSFAELTVPWGVYLPVVARRD